jgi:hypothetical protein
MSCDALRRLEEHDGILDLAQESVNELASEGVQNAGTWGELQELRDRLAERRLDLLANCPAVTRQEVTA